MCFFLSVNLISIENWVEPPVCRYFLNGNCRYGDFCRNSHAVRPETAMRSTTTRTATAAMVAPVAPIDTNAESQDPNNNCTRTTEAMRNWIDAPEFVPRYITQNVSCDETTNQANDIQGASRLVNHLLDFHSMDFSQIILFLFTVNSSQPISYAQIVSGNAYEVGDTGDGQSNLAPPPYAETTLCPYIQTSITKSDGTISCKYGDRCPYQHGELCDICGSYCLHPNDQNQRNTHQKVCPVNGFKVGLLNRIMFMVI